MQPFLKASCWFLLRATLTIPKPVPSWLHSHPMSFSGSYLKWPPTFFHNACHQRHLQVVGSRHSPWLHADSCCVSPGLGTLKFMFRRFLIDVFSPGSKCPAGASIALNVRMCARSFKHTGLQNCPAVFMWRSEDNLQDYFFPLTKWV